LCLERPYRMHPQITSVTTEPKAKLPSAKQRPHQCSTASCTPHLRAWRCIHVARVVLGDLRRACGYERKAEGRQINSCTECVGHAEGRAGGKELERRKANEGGELYSWQWDPAGSIYSTARTLPHACHIRCHIRLRMTVTVPCCLPTANIPAGTDTQLAALSSKPGQAPSAGACATQEVLCWQPSFAEVQSLTGREGYIQRLIRWIGGSVCACSG